MELRRMITGMCNNELPHRLATLLDGYSGMDQDLRIDSINVDISLTNSSDLKENLLNIITEKIEIALQKVAREQTSVGSERPTETEFLTLLTFFLQHGSLPWWSSIQTSDAWKKRLDQFFTEHVEQKVVPQSIIPLLNEQSVRQRLAATLTEEQIQLLVLAVHPDKQSTLSALKESLASLFKKITEQKLIISSHELIIIWRSALLATLVAPGTDFEKLFVAHLARLLKAASFIDTIPALISTESFKRFLVHLEKMQTSEIGLEKASTLENAEEKEIAKNRSSDKKEGIYTAHAGLVLIANYLPTFFNHLELIVDGKISNKARAITLLHYLGTGRSEFEEFEISFEKVLCGIESDDLVLSTHVLSTEEKTEANELLTAMISHWSALKSTSPQGLQESFLMREGRLSEKNNQWHLNVQRQSLDVLLDFIPWNFKMIRLPWMNGLLHVNWD